MNLREVAAFAGVTALLAVALSRCGRAPDPALEASRDSLITATQHQLAVDVGRRRTDAAAFDSVHGVLTRIAQRRTAVDTMRLRKDSLVADDSLRPALAIADSIIRIQDGQIAELEATVRLVLGRWTSADSAANAWQALASVANDHNEQLLAELRRRSPRFACVAGAGGAAGFGGAAAGFSVTCGMRI